MTNVYVFIPYFKPTKSTELIKTDHKMHFISGANFYTFQHQGALYKEFIYNKIS